MFPGISRGQLRALNAQSDEQLRLELADELYPADSPDRSGPPPGPNRPVAPRGAGSQGERSEPTPAQRGLTASDRGATTPVSLDHPANERA